MEINRDLNREKPILPCNAEKVRETGDATVKYTNDGDTAAFMTADGTEIRTRLIGIDTPETHFNRTDQGPWAFKAAERLKQLLPEGKAVKIRLDQQICDPHNRTLGYVYVDGVNLNRLMIEEGWAVNYCVAPNTAQCEDFAELVEQNIKEKHGFLGDPSVKVPYVFRADAYQSDYVYYIGNILTKRVVYSTHIEDVPIPQRVFFYSRRQVLPPYKLAPGVR